MQIKNSFDKNTGLSLAKNIYEIIRKDTKLTYRKIKYLQKKISERSVYVMSDRKKMYGFIIKDRLMRNYYEIKSWYVLPKFRNKGIGSKLLGSATKDKNKTYLMSTFDNRSLRIAEGSGFNKISFRMLPKSILIKYLLTRNIRSIYKHFFKQKSSLLIK